MADKAEKKSDAAAPSAGDKGDGKGHVKGGGLMTKTPVLLGAVMLLEAVVLFAGFKFIGGGPRAATGAELGAAEGRVEAVRRRQVPHPQLAGVVLIGGLHVVGPPRS